MENEDNKLLDLLASLGHQVTGLRYTEGTVRKGIDPAHVLDSRKECLREDLDKLIAYIKETY